MSKFNLKFKLIYARVLVILFIFVAIYSFLHWLLFIRLQVYDIRENIIVWVLPFILPALPVWIWLRKRIRLLDLRTKKGGNNFYTYLIFIHLFIGGVTVAFQYFLINATGELRTLKSPEEIVQYNRTKYYTIGQFYANKSGARLQRFSHTGGRRGRTLNYEIFITVPFYQAGNNSRAMAVGDSVPAPMETGSFAPVKIKTVNDTAEASVPTIWVCLSYKRKLSNRSSPEAKDSAWAAFHRECIEDFKNDKLQGFTYFEYPGNNEQRDKLMQTVEGYYYEGTILPYVLVARYSPYNDRYSRELEILLVILVIGGGIVFAMIISTGFDEQALQKFRGQPDADIDFPRGYM